LGPLTFQCGTNTLNNNPIKFSIMPLVFLVLLACSRARVERKLDSNATQLVIFELVIEVGVFCWLELMDTGNETPRPPQGEDGEPSIDADEMFTDDDNESPSADGGEPAMDTDNWRSRLQPDTRQRIVNTILETLMRHLPFSGQEGLQELREIAVRFEEKIYTSAPSLSDYLRKISQKMQTVETKSQKTMTNSIQFNSDGN
ncbi:unnamed protein product, partial [Prunus brigantina]